MRLAWRRRGRSGRGVLHAWADNRSVVGKTGLGDLVDVGCAAHNDFCSLAAIHYHFLCCVRWWRKPRGVPESARCSESLLFSTCRWCTFQTAFGALSTPRQSFSAPQMQGSTPPWAKYCCYVSLPWSRSLPFFFSTVTILSVCAAHS